MLKNDPCGFRDDPGTVIGSWENSKCIVRTPFGLLYVIRKLGTKPIDNYTPFLVKKQFDYTSI